MMRLVVISLMFVMSVAAYGQIKFFKMFGDSGYDVGMGLVQLEDSSYMVTGYSSSFFEGPSQVFMLKIDKEGNHIWAKDFGGAESDNGTRIMSWNDSVFFIAGHSNSFGAGDFDAYLIKANKNGQLLDQFTYGDTGWEKINDALITPDSLIVMVGETTSTSNSNSNFYILCADHNGNELWNLNFGSIGEDRFNSVKQLNDTTFYAVGTQYNVDSTLNKAAVVRFYKNGTVDWIKEFGQYGEYHLNDFYFYVNSIYAIGQRKYPDLGDWDPFNLRMFINGDYESEDAGHADGDVTYKGLTPYGTNGYVYVASNYKNQFSIFNTQDVAYERFYGSLYWYEQYVQVGSGMDDTHGDIIQTSDEGAAAVGTVQSDEIGGSAVYVIKIGANDDFPAVSFSNYGTLVSLSELIKNDELLVFPNPTNGMFRIQTLESGNSRYEVIDLQGKLCVSGDFNGSVEIETEQWKNGLYLIKVTYENGRIQNHKLIVNH